MTRYAKTLINEGITSGNAHDLSVAMDLLHSAIAHLDKEARVLFFAVPLEQRLSNYAIEEDLDDVTQMILQTSNTCALCQNTGERGIVDQYGPAIVFCSCSIGQQKTREQSDILSEHGA